MKKWSGICVLLLIMLLTACSGTPKWAAEIATTPQYDGEQSYPMVIEVTENGKPVTGLMILAQLEMERMDHGQIEAQFVEQGEGFYQANVKLSMGGDWIAGIELTDGKVKVEKTLTFTVAGR